MAHLRVRGPRHRPSPTGDHHPVPTPSNRSVTC